MRILIVHHGRLPSPDGPVSGGALRAWHHGRALQAAGHELRWLSRAQDEAGGFSSPAELVIRARSLRPDRILCIQPEDAPALRVLDVPLAVDLYAPRLLEAPFEGTLAREAMHSLRALSAGDVFLVSNRRQRLAWLGVMALAGLDTRTDPTLHVPIVAPEGPRRRIPKTPVLVAGGASWPWQDPRPALERVLAFLDARGEGVVRWYGGRPVLGESEQGWTLPEHPRLEAPGWLPYERILGVYAGASLALDWMEPNPERSLAFSFRHADYLGCGLPVLTGEDTALADILGEAGWAVPQDAIEATLQQALDAPDDLRQRSRAARELARRHLSLEVAEAPLLRWIESPIRHPRATGPLVEAAELAARAASAEARQQAAEQAQVAAEVEVQHKREEVARLNAQVQDLLSTTARLARAIDEVAGFKREAVTILGSQGEQARLSQQEAERELAIARADIEKKNAELEAMDQLRARLENDVRNLREEVQRLRRPGLLRR